MYGLTHRKKPARESSELASISAAVAALEAVVATSDSKDHGWGRITAARRGAAVI